MPISFLVAAFTDEIDGYLDNAEFFAGFFAHPVHVPGGFFHRLGIADARRNSVGGFLQIGEEPRGDQVFFGGLHELHCR